MTSEYLRARRQQVQSTLPKKPSFQGISLDLFTTKSTDSSAAKVCSSSPHSPTHRLTHKTNNQPFDSEQKYLNKTSLSAPGTVPHRANKAILYTFIALALFTRLYQIGKANTVVWDEAHFGKFAGFYQTRKWYTDLHPPLGKSLLGLFANFVGYDGKFGFDSGATYPPTLFHTPFRACCAFLAALTVPLAYLTGLELHLSQDASVFLGVMALTDVATLVLSRFILLDPLLLFFTSLSLFAVFRFRNYQRVAVFTRGWWVYLGLTGFAIGATMSVKWVGLFVVIIVGLHTVNDLGAMLLEKPKVVPYVMHWVARILCLILLPLSVYLGAFYIHFAVLTNSGPGDGKMGSLFQYHLKGVDMQTGPVNVWTGSEVQIRYHGAGGGLLHSHPHNYPVGSKEQQVTLYGWRRDDNNRMILLDAVAGKEKHALKHGDLVRIQHKLSKKLLRVHEEFGAPTSGEKYREVSFGGEEGTVGKGEVWKIVVVDELGKSFGGSGQLKTLLARFRIQSQESGCWLRSDHMTKLDKVWGFDQHEVACTHESPNWENSRNALWNIEEHWNPELPPGKKSDYPWSFFSAFMDDNYDKMLGNSMLVPEPGKAKSSIESYPWEWPTLQTNLVVGGAGWSYNIIGHPLIWLGVTAALITYLAVAAVYLIRYFQGAKDWKSSEQLHDFWFMFKIGILGWLVNFIPYILMPRVTYIHHYLPALQFGMILFAYIVEHLLVRLLPRQHMTRRLVFWVLICIDLGIFWYFKDFVFGYKNGWEYRGRKWFKAWNI
ncbi:Protein O-mannosyltransferase 2 [Rhizoclosmatium sp. JEL0117]|nr:Protein O-mannosyltransferase 2 [Rhizoclosmatium sp. JEL0117]